MNMLRFQWVRIETVLWLQEQSLMRFGGSSGLRDRGLLESAMSRTQDLLSYSENVGAAELAAACLVGIARNLSLRGRK